MNALTLQRFGSIPGQLTAGSIVYGEDTCRTVEQHWDNNTPYGSCVPCGEYELVPFHSYRFGIDTYALHNPARHVYVKESDIPNELLGIARFSCLLHPANVASQLQGCIAPGKKFDVLKVGTHPAQLGVSSSRSTYERLMRYIKANNIRTLFIEPYPQTWSDAL